MVEIVMSLGEYLERRANGNKLQAALTKKEADIIGIPFPLRRGWSRQYKNLLLSQAQQEKLHEAIKVHRVSKKELRAARVKEDYAKAVRYGWRPPESLISSRRAIKSVPTISKSKSSNKFFANSFAFVATDAFLESFEWRKIRMEALKKYGAKCMCCGATPAIGAVMNVDHIKPRKKFPELALSIDNLQILCHDCNHGKGNWDMTDWRN